MPMAQTMEKQQVSQPVIVFLGKLGHGKTRLVNLLCGTNFSSSMTAGSCTTELHRATMQNFYIQIVDTPGFASSDDVSGHTEHQVEALESCELSGVYIIVKNGRLGDMASTIGTIMDFADTDEARIIVTFADHPPSEDPSFQDTKAQLAKLMGVNTEHIMMVGKNTTKETLEDFVQSTLHPPKRYHVSAESKAYANTQQVGARQGIVLMKALFESLQLGDQIAFQRHQEGLTKVAHSLTAEERQILFTKIRETFPPNSEILVRSVWNPTRRPVLSIADLFELLSSDLTWNNDVCNGNNLSSPLLQSSTDSARDAKGDAAVVSGRDLDAMERGSFRSSSSLDVYCSADEDDDDVDTRRKNDSWGILGLCLCCISCCSIAVCVTQWVHPLIESWKAQP